MAAVTVMSTLLRRHRRFALIAAFVLAPALLLVKGMLDVRHGAILSLRHFLEALEHLIGYAILAREFYEFLLAIGNFAPLRPWAKSAADVRAMVFSPVRLHSLRRDGRA